MNSSPETRLAKPNEPIPSTTGAKRQRWLFTIQGLTLIIAGVLTSQDSRANVIMGYKICNTNNVDVGTNLVVNTPYRVGVYLDSTPEPTVGINYADWDITLPTGGGYTNLINFTGASLPNHNSVEDFFYGFTMDSSRNRIDSTPTSGLLDDNVRAVLTADGPTNRVSYLGWYDFTTKDRLATNRTFTVSTAHVYDTFGASKTISYVNPKFNIVNVIPEPSTAGLLGFAGAVGAIAAWRRYERRKRRAGSDLE